MKKQIIITITLLLAMATSIAQDGTTLHFMRLNPYSTNINPSSFIQYEGYVGVPIVSNINIALTNSGLHYNNIFITDPSTGAITAIDANRMIDKMSENGDMINSNISLNLIDFGFRIKDWNISFSYRIRSDEYFIYSKDLFGFLVKGNLAYAGDDNPAHIQIKEHIDVYQEFGVGLRWEVNSHLAVGFKPKLVFGMINSKSKNMDALINTDPLTYAMCIRHQLDVKEASVLPSDSNASISIGQMLGQSFRNFGMGIDLGATYRINDNFGVAASILDLGFIDWRTNSAYKSYNLDSSGHFYNNGSFYYDGITLYDIEQISENPEGYEKELARYISTVNNSVDHYAQALVGRFTLEGYYNLGKNHRFTALFQGRIVNNRFLPSFTLAWNGTFLNIFDLCVNYTMAKHSYDNLGIGIGFNLGVFHIYAVTDNLISLCGVKQMVNHTNVNLQFGLVFDWGKLQEPELGGWKKKEANFRQNVTEQ